MNVGYKKILAPGGLIFLIDDDKSILEMMASILDKFGYRVICSQNGAEALNIFKEKYPEISLVMLDMIMPAMSGEEIFGELKKISPDVNVLMTSGMLIDSRLEGLLKKGVLGILQKPFTIDELIEKLESLAKT